MALRETKSRVVHVRLSEVEHSRLLAFCSQARRTPSEVLRRLAREAGDYGPTFEGETRAAIIAYAKQLRAIGININQVARALNAGRAPSFQSLQDGLGALTQALIQQEQDYLSLCGAVRRRAEKSSGRTE